MAATVGLSAVTITGAGTFGPMLKEFYQGPVAEQINNRVWMREYFQKKSKGWSGKQMVVPIHIGRNNGVGFQGEAPGNLPTAGQQQYRDLRINSHSSYGRFQVSGLAMDTASTAGVGAFAGVMNEEMDRLVRDIANNENSMNIFGGPTKGLLNQRRAGTSTPIVVGGQDSAALGTFSVAQEWQYQGDFGYFDGSRTGLTVAAATIGTWVKVELVRLDTYEEVVVPGGNSNIMVTAISADRTNPTVTLRYGSDSAVAVNFDLTTVGGQAGIALRIAGARAVDSAASGSNPFGQNPVLWDSGALAVDQALGAQNVIANQPRGLFENLASQTHFGVARNDTTATGVDLDQQLTGVLGTAATNIMTDGSSGKLMDNQQNLAYGGVKFQYDRQFPVSTIGLLHSSDWLLAELATGQFADEDGNILFRVQGQDAYEGFWKHRYNICCKRPNAQVILTGITPT